MTFIFDGQHLEAGKSFLFDNISYNCSHDWRTTFSNHDNLLWRTTCRSHEVIFDGQHLVITSHKFCAGHYLVTTKVKFDGQHW